MNRAANKLKGYEMNKFYMVASDNASQTHGGKFDSLKEAKEFACDASIKHLKNDGYIVLEAMYYVKSSVTVYTQELEINSDK